jgi:hypothetical protein
MFRCLFTEQGRSKFSICMRIRKIRAHYSILFMHPGCKATPSRVRSKCPWSSCCHFISSWWPPCSMPMSLPCPHVPKMFVNPSLGPKKSPSAQVILEFVFWTCLDFVKYYHISHPQRLYLDVPQGSLSDAEDLCLQEKHDFHWFSVSIITIDYHILPWFSNMLQLVDVDVRLPKNMADPAVRRSDGTPLPRDSAEPSCAWRCARRAF